MKSSILSSTILALLLIAIPSQGLAAAATSAMAADKRSSIVQLQDTMKRFQKTVKSYARCAATGQCETEHQKKLIYEVGDLTKKLILLLAVIGLGAYARKRILEDLAQQKEEIVETAKYLGREAKESYRTEKVALKAEVIAIIDERLNRIESKFEKGYGKVKEDVKAAKVDVPSLATGGRLGVSQDPVYAELQQLKKDIESRDLELKDLRDLVKKVGKEIPTAVTTGGAPAAQPAAPAASTAPVESSGWLGGLKAYVPSMPSVWPAGDNQ